MLNPAAVSRMIATQFLQTVVIVDDRADLRFSEAPNPGSAGPLALSGAGDDQTAEAPDLNKESNAEDAGTGAIPEPGLEAPSEDALSVADHGDLDAKTIIDRFAHLGLVCGVIRPEEADELRPIVDPAARRADVLVLDWWMYGDGGARSKEIIADVARSDSHQNRIRLIIVYTAVTDLANVAAEVAGILDGAKVLDSNRVVAGSDLRRRELDRC